MLQNTIYLVLMSIAEPISYYGMLESRNRLEQDGFHPNVTLKTPKQIEGEVIAQLKSEIKRASRRDFYESQKIRLAPKIARKKHRGGRHKGHDKSLGVLTKVSRLSYPKIMEYNNTHDTHRAPGFSPKTSRRLPRERRQTITAAMYPLWYLYYNIVI
jgi:hypothetical protein